MQKPVQQFVSPCGQARIFVENEMPIGVFHDFLMMIKGLMVDRMVQAHKEQEDQAKAAMILPTHESELPTDAPYPYVESNGCGESIPATNPQ
jgi:hypothetical protein